MTKDQTREKIEKVEIKANHFKTLVWGIKLGRILGLRFLIKFDHPNKGKK